ncbi:MAG: hypothetical protein UF067_10885 [Paludibacteraceae bacterium]|nr:hypothetical protein [Paludibacteraceae bacterium]
MKKKLLLCGLIAFTAFNFVACDDEDDNNATNNNSTSDTVSNDSISDGEGTNSNLSAEFIEASDCLGETLLSEERPLSIAYKYNAENGEVELITKDVVLNCAATPSTEFAFNGDTVVVRFADKNEGLPTDCTCFFNLTSKLKGAESKVYYISTNKGVSQLDLSKNQEGEIQF